MSVEGEESCETMEEGECVRNECSILQEYRSCYKNKPQYDIVLIAGEDGLEIPAHRKKLSESSDFFLAMYRNNFKETAEEKFVLKDFDGVTLKLLIDFIYTHEIELDCETAEPILRAADFLQMMRLKKICLNFMIEQLDITNCMSLFAYAEQYCYTDLQKLALQLACKHFDDAYMEDEFLEMKEQHLDKLLSSKDLVTRSEENVFYSVGKWLEYDLVNRKEHTGMLLSRVMFTLLTPHFILDNRKMVCRDLECYELICKWIHWQSSTQIRSKLPTITSAFRKSPYKIAAVSGCTLKLKVQALIADLNIWFDLKVSDPFLTRINFSTLVIHQKLIILGGRINSKVTNIVEYLDLQSMEWKKLPPMRLPREYAALAELNGDLYVVGGYSGIEWLTSVEKYDFYAREWQDVTPMNITFTNIEVTADYECLYVTSNDSPRVTRFNLRTGSWTRMPNADQFDVFGIVSVKDVLYAVGNYAGRCRVNQNVHRYNPLEDTWSFVSSSKVEGSSSIVVSSDDRIILVGGFDARGQVLDIVEEYDPEEDHWQSLAPLPMEAIISMSSIMSM